MIFRLILLLSAFSVFSDCRKKDSKFLILASPVSEELSIPVFSIPAGTYFGDQVLEITQPDPDAEIIYKMDYNSASVKKAGTEMKYLNSLDLPSDEDGIYSVHAYAQKNGQKSKSLSASYQVRNRVVSPVIVPSGGMFAEPQDVTLKALTKNAVIRYTVGDALPDRNSGTVYRGEKIHISADNKIHAIAYMEDAENETSDIVEEKYVFIPDIPKPEFSVSPGIYTDFISLKIRSLVSGVSIRYTLDGSTPTSSNGLLIPASSAWTAGEGSVIEIQKTVTVKAVAYSDHKTSETLSGIFTISVPSVPEFSIPGGEYANPQTLSLNAPSGQEIWYTLNGSVPSPVSAIKYGSPIIIPGNTKVSAISCFPNTSNCTSAVSANYVILSRLAPPVFSPVPGEFSSAQSVTLSSNEPNAKIYYTLDGSMPVPGVSPMYSSPILIQSTANIRTLAVMAGYTDSAESSGIYSIRMFSDAHISQLVNLANVSYGQLAGEGLTSEVQRAQSLVRANPSLISNSSLRTKFLNQNGALAASELCTVISRYLYLYAFSKIYPERLQNLPSGFAEFYVYAVNKGYVITDSGGVTFNWTADGYNMVKDFTVPLYFSSWIKYRTDAGFGTDGSLLSFVSGKEGRLFFLSDGPDGNGATHNFLAVMHPVSGFKMLDTYHHAWTGKGFYENANVSSYYAVRFGASGTRWLHIVNGYLQTK